jgi:NADPH:quinone reductase-like Zn-dependent oxidoreductase
VAGDTAHVRDFACWYKEKIMSHESILVTGAAGGTGSTAHTAIAILLEQGHHVRAMVRKLDTRADALRDMGAEIVVADMLDIIAVRAAMQGCSVVYFTMSISPNYLEAATNVAVAAKSMGVRAFVILSQMTVSKMSETETTSSPQQKQHWLAEQMLGWSGLPVVTCVRPLSLTACSCCRRPKASARITPSAYRLPTARPRLSPALTWGLPLLQCLPTQRRILARSMI